MVEKSSSLSFNGALVRFAVCGFNFSSSVVNPVMVLLFFFFSELQANVAGGGMAVPIWRSELSLLYLLATENAIKFSPLFKAS